MPPPDDPSTVFCPSSSCILEIRDCISWACFNKLPIPPIPFAIKSSLPFGPRLENLFHQPLTVFPPNRFDRSAKNPQRLFYHRTALVSLAHGFASRGLVFMTQRFRTNSRDMDGHVIAKKTLRQILQQRQIIGILKIVEMMPLGNRDFELSRRKFERAPRRQM